MKIKQADFTEASISQLEALENKCFPEDAWSRVSIVNAFKNSALQTYFLQKNEKVIGYTILQVIAGEGEIQRIGIESSERRKGLGYYLLSDIMNQELFTECFLDVDEHNISAIKLYEKLGFVTVGSRKAYYKNGNAATLMKWKKDIDENE